MYLLFAGGDSNEVTASIQIIQGGGTIHVDSEDTEEDYDDVDEPLDDVLYYDDDFVDDEPIDDFVDDDYPVDGKFEY